MKLLGRLVIGLESERASFSLSSFCANGEILISPRVYSSRSLFNHRWWVIYIGMF